MIRERPIIMDSESVRAILDGRKTQTRRVMSGDSLSIIDRFSEPGFSKFWIGYHDDTVCYREECPYGVPGDSLWVKETWNALFFNDKHILWSGDVPKAMRTKERLVDSPVYRATDNDPEYPWRSPIHMPRWASRITLEIVSVRVERVQEISEDDARREGVDAWFPKSPELLRYVQEGGSYRNGFHERWDALNAARGYPWSSNPWVWVIEFRRIEP